jgi:hypothetical protein
MTGVGGAGNSAAVETVTPGSSSSLAAQPAANSGDAAPSSSSDSTANPTDNANGANSGSALPANSTTPAPPADKSQESTSKKKKGIHKVLPF